MQYTMGALGVPQACVQRYDSVKAVVTIVFGTASIGVRATAVCMTPHATLTLRVLSGRSGGCAGQQRTSATASAVSLMSYSSAVTAFCSGSSRRMSASLTWRLMSCTHEARHTPHTLRRLRARPNFSPRIP